ncbi:hypothetical protein J7J62_07460 [bacterium]|nr:hypothetical protein [bacterium]
MASNYPNDYDSFTTWQDFVDTITASIVNNIQDAIVAIEQTLGKNPQGDYPTVKDRLDSLGNGTGSGGRWQLIEEVIFTDSAQTYTFSNLNGNNDEEYLLSFRIRSQLNTSANIELRFNNDSESNYDNQRLIINGTTVDASSWNGNALEIGQQNPTNNFIIFGEAYIFAKSGYCRTLICHSNNHDSLMANIKAYRYGGHWKNGTDNITSITIRGTYSGILGADTVLRLYKKI